MRPHQRLCRAVLPVSCLGLLSACGSSGGAHITGTAPFTPTVTAIQTPTQPPSATATQVNATASLPTTCAQLPVSLISTDIGGIATTMPLRQSATGVSCEFAGSSATELVIVTVGRGTTADLARVEAQTAAKQTVTPVPGFEAGAYTVSKNGVVRGLVAVSAGGLLVSVSSTLTESQDEALIQKIVGG